MQENQKNVLNINIHSSIRETRAAAKRRSEGSDSAAKRRSEGSNEVSESSLDPFSTPMKQPTPKSFLSPTIEYRLRNINTSAQEQLYKSPGGGVLNTTAFTTILGNRIYEPSCKKSHNSLLSHTQTKHQKDIDQLSSTDTVSRGKATSITHVHYIILKSTKVKVVECSRLFYNTKSKASIVTGIGAYTEIAKKLKSLCEQFKDKVIAESLFDILNERPMKLFNHLNSTELTSLNKFMSRLCYLLFSAEVDRFEGALIINAMFLDLVKAGEYKMHDILSLGLSDKGVMLAVRKVNSIVYKALDQDRTYDLSIKNLPGVNDKKVHNLLTKNHKIFEDWFKLNCPQYNFQDISIPHKTLIITSKIKEWFDIDIKPFRVDIPASGLNDSGFVDTVDEEDTEQNSFNDHECTPLVWPDDPLPSKNEEASIDVSGEAHLPPD
jgi:hypothetical protein